MREWGRRHLDGLDEHDESSKALVTTLFCIVIMLQGLALRVTPETIGGDKAILHRVLVGLKSLKKSARSTWKRPDALSIISATICCDGQL